MKTGYYAVARGRSTGIYKSWAECERQVKGFQNARYKKFATEAEAVAFIAQNGFKGTASGVVNSHFKAASSTRKTHAKPRQSRVGSAASQGSSTCSEIPVVYTDGACSSNGRAGAAAGIGVYWGEQHSDNISEPLMNGPPTNNRAELTAVIRAIETAVKRGHQRLIVRTDSNLLIQSMNSWIHGWRKNGWKTGNGTDVKNQDLIKQLDSLLKTISVQFEHVAGHAGIFGNERADQLAREGAARYGQL